MSRAQTSAWARRRAAVQAESEAEAEAAKLAAQAQSRAQSEASQADKSDDEILQELSLQDPDQMQAGDNFAAFMREEVPQRLRQRALRTLWRSNPVLACVDDLVDYGDDFKAEGLGLGAIKTAYRVGKGMLAHVEEMQAQSDAATAQTEPEIGPEIGPETEATPEVARDPQPGTPEPVTAEPVITEMVAENTSGQPPAPDSDDAAPQAFARSRMRFDFEKTA